MEWLTCYFERKTIAQSHIFHLRFGIKNSPPISNKRPLVSHTSFTRISGSSTHDLFRIEIRWSATIFHTRFGIKHSQTISNRKPSLSQNFYLRPIRKQSKLTFYFEIRRSVTYLSHAFRYQAELTGYFPQRTIGQSHIFHERFEIKQDSLYNSNRRPSLSQMLYLYPIRNQSKLTIYSQ